MRKILFAVFGTCLLAAQGQAGSGYEVKLSTQPNAETRQAVLAKTAGEAKALPVEGAEDKTMFAENVLRAGTPVPLKTREVLTTKGKHLKVGYRFQMEVSEDVVVDGVTVIPVGSPAVGEVTDVRYKGMWGKSGRINARPLYARVGNRQIRLTGAAYDKGQTGTAGVVGAIAFVPIAGFFLTGTSAEFPIGTPISGFVDEDVPFQSRKAAMEPLQIP